MEIRVHYGSGTTDVSIPEVNLAAIVRPNRTSGVDERDVVRRALESPVGSPPLGDFLANLGSLVVIVNDAMRPTPTAKVLELVHPLVLQVPEVELVVATGTHRAPTEGEFERILGDLRGFYHGRTFVHDARDASSVSSVGVTSRGNEVLLNRRVLEAHGILVIGSVEPHYFAGYTGGRKSLLPGVAAFETVERNHAFAMEPASRPAALEGNPVHEDMIEAARLLADHPIFTIMTVLDADGRVCATASGSIGDAFDAAVTEARRVFEVSVERTADVVVAVATPPMDMNLYQSHKALEHGRLALSEGGVIVLVSECREGLGDRTFVDLLAAAASPRHALESLRESYRLGEHKVARIADMAAHANIWTVTSLDPGVIESIFMSPFATLQAAVDEALARTGPHARVLVLPDASVTLPIVA